MDVRQVCTEDEIDDSLCRSSTNGNSGGPNEESRDEVREVQRMAAKETKRIGLWRLAMVASLLVTGTVVTLKTYRFLNEEQENNFNTAVSLIS